MISLLEVAERTRKGPKMAEMDWNMGLFQKMNELAERFRLEVPKEDSWDNFFNHDDALAERALEAGIAFLAEMGTYCIQTERVVHFTAEEVREAIAEAPRQVVVGEGEDARSFGEGPSTVPKGQGTGALHAPFEDEIAVDVARTFVESVDIGYIQSYNFQRLHGREIHGVPMEAAAGRRAIAQMREAVRQAGKPGMSIFYYPISTADAVLTAPIDPVKGLRPTDGVLFSTLPDIKLDMEMLTAAIVYADYGAQALNGGGGAAAGGFCGGIAGAIIESIAKPILGWMVFRDVLGGGGIRDVRSSRRKTFKIQPIYSWGSSVSSQALGKANPLWGGRGLNTGGGVGHSSGPGTRTHLLETAMASIGSGVAGGHGSAADWHVSTMNARRTPYELIFAAEVAAATRRAGITENDLPALMKQFTPKLEGLPTEPGRDIRECWDLKNNRPLPAYAEVGKAIQRELAEEFGLVFG
ncbi:MAG: monomethylamine:corrinoid methyltransferase [Chloroflexi bacterium]|nr:monomethylamine:corrinoid methyltransferase [Chloroflexota bacterium]